MGADNDRTAVARGFDSEHKLAVLKPRETEQRVTCPELGGAELGLLRAHDGDLQLVRGAHLALLLLVALARLVDPRCSPGTLNNGPVGARSRPGVPWAVPWSISAQAAECGGPNVPGLGAPTRGGSRAVAQTTEPQGILEEPTEAAIFLVLVVNEGGEAAVRELLGDVGGLIRSVAFRIPDGGLSCVVGIGSDLWDRLALVPRPAGLHPFAEVAGDRHTAVSTAGDILLHIRARRTDLCFELAQRLVERLRPVAEVVDEVHGFKSFDERDLLGFVDGTENPTGAAAPEAALIGNEDPSFAGGSYVIVQRYVHDLASWDALSVAEQERAVGRTKLNDIELADDVKPANSHVALTTIIDEEGEQRQILRYNMPFGASASASSGPTSSAMPAART